MPRLSASLATAIQGRLKLARLLEMPEHELARLVAKLEADPFFTELRRARVVSLNPFPKAYFTARKFAGWGLRTSSEGLPELLDGDCDLVRLMQKVGQERFERCFLKEEKLTDAERGRLCGITAGEAKELREFLDRAFIQAEFERPSPAPEKVFSSVAGIQVEQGRPVLAFFHREVWKGRYKVDESLLSGYLRSRPGPESERIQAFLRRLQFIDQRKSTLYKVLEALLDGQAEYLVTGDPGRRQPLTQRSLAVALDVDPSTLNRLISNKSVQLPWGLEAPLKALVPSAKALSLGRLEALACESPGLSDEKLRDELAKRHDIRLSRRSITQYRKDLGLGARGRRGGS